MTPPPSQMNAVEINGFGPPDVLRLVQRPVPPPAPGEVLIRVRAAGVNRPDVVQREGRYAPPPGASDLPGLEIAGEIAALGEGTEGFTIGDQVCALLAGGGYAEYACAPAGQCLPLPRGLSFTEAASLPETCFTVWENIFDRGGFQTGGRAIVTVGSPEKAAACEALGAAPAINYRTTDFVEAVKTATDGKGANIILDMVGGDYLILNMKAAAIEGRIVYIAALEGGKPPVDILLMMHKRLTITGSMLRSRPIAVKAAIAAQLRTHVWPLIEAGAIKPKVYQTFPLAQAAEAHRLMESSSNIGKIVLVVE